MKKILFHIILIGLFYSCSSDEHSNKIDKRLFAGNSKLNAKFDFSLSRLEQLDYLQSQIDQNLCYGISPINTNFNLKGELIETLILFDRHCEENIDGIFDHKYYVPSIEILINSQGKILLDRKLTSFDKLKSKIESQIDNNKDYFGDSKFIAFEINWNSKTDIEFRQKVFTDCLLAYQNYMTTVAYNKYNKCLMDLSQEELENLKLDLRFALHLQNINIGTSTPLSIQQIDSLQGKF